MFVCVFFSLFLFRCHDTIKFFSLSLSSTSFAGGATILTISESALPFDCTFTTSSYADHTSRIRREGKICIFFHVKLLLQSFAFLIANSSIKWLDGRGIAYSIIRHLTPSLSLSTILYLSFFLTLWHSLFF